MRTSILYSVSTIIGIPLPDNMAVDLINRTTTDYSEREAELQEQENREEIRKYVNTLTKAELREMLIEYMYDERYGDHYWSYYFGGSRVGSDKCVLCSSINDERFVATGKNTTIDIDIPILQRCADSLDLTLYALLYG